jgi:hypothetical protein
MRNPANAVATTGAYLATMFVGQNDFYYFK